MFQLNSLYQWQKKNPAKCKLQIETMSMLSVSHTFRNEINSFNKIQLGTFTSSIFLFTELLASHSSIWIMLFPSVSSCFVFHHIRCANLYLLSIACTSVCLSPPFVDFAFIPPTAPLLLIHSFIFILPAPVSDVPSHGLKAHPFF